jgi:hypothetical protein
MTATMEWSVILSEAKELQFARAHPTPEVSDNGANPITRATGASARAASTNPHT